MEDAAFDPSGFRYDPPQLKLEKCSVRDAGASLSNSPVVAMLPRSLVAEDGNLPKTAIPGPNPYVDYATRYTAEGGIQLTYKSNEMTIWRIILRVAAWCAVMGVLAWLLLSGFAYGNGCPDALVCTYTTGQMQGGGIASAIVGLALILTLAQPHHAIHTVEVRPDCLILDGRDVFWAAYMEARPAIRPNEDNGYTLRGIYGTRYMEFLTLKPADENDATPAVLAAHLENAFRQLWDRPQVWSGD